MMPTEPISTLPAMQSHFNSLHKYAPQPISPEPTHIDTPWAGSKERPAIPNADRCMTTVPLAHARQGLDRDHPQHDSKYLWNFTWHRAAYVTYYVHTIYVCRIYLTPRTFKIAVGEPCHHRQRSPGQPLIVQFKNPRGTFTTFKTMAEENINWALHNHALSGARMRG
jgi:hypothetical protein